MFGCYPIGYGCGYNPGFSNTMTGMQAGLAGLRGIVGMLDARNNGANPFQAVSYGLGTTTMGIGNALLGNVIDKSTHSYMGTTMNGVMNSFTGGNPFAASMAMTSAAMFTAPPMMYGGFYSAWSSPFMFGGPMPMFGGFSCHC